MAGKGLAPAPGLDDIWDVKLWKPTLPHDVFCHLTGQRDKTHTAKVTLSKLQSFNH